VEGISRVEIGRKRGNWCLLQKKRRQTTKVPIEVVKVWKSSPVGKRKGGPQEKTQKFPLPARSEKKEKRVGGKQETM